MRMLTRRAVLSVAVVSTIAVGARATEVGPDGPVRELYAALDAAMRSPQTQFLRRFDALAPVVYRVFDLETVLKASVGLRWDSLDPESRARLYQAYRRFTVATYVANFSRYDGEDFQILSGSRDLGRDRIVGTEIISRSGHLRVDYVMRESTGAWRAVDVLFDGSISRVAVQRADFRKVLASGDGDALIASLHRKIADLSDGALS